MARRVGRWQSATLAGGSYNALGRCGNGASRLESRPKAKVLLRAAQGAEGTVLAHLAGSADRSQGATGAIGGYIGPGIC